MVADVNVCLELGHPENRVGRSRWNLLYAARLSEPPCRHEQDAGDSVTHDSRHVVVGSPIMAEMFQKAGKEAET